MADAIRGWGLQLNGQDNRDIRYCIRRARLSFVAIDECGVPLIETILPYAATNAAILKALIALSTRQRKTVGETLQNIATTGNHSGQYQSALENLRMEMEHLSRSGLHNETKISGILASALLLSLFGFPESNGGWTQPVSGMISIINSTDLSILVSSPLGRFLLSFSSHLDISAFSLGRTEKSHRSWLSRNLGLGHSAIPFDPGQRAHGVFSPLEVIVAYPESLTFIIAILSKEFEDRMDQDARQSRSLTGSFDPLAPSYLDQIPPANAQNIQDEGQFLRIEKLILDWSPPILPPTLTSDLRLALSVAWETFRKAALIFHWRGRGFFSDLRMGIREDRSAQTSVYIREVISSVQSLVKMADEKGFVIANAMLWPMTVIACECDSGVNSWKSEIFALFSDIQKKFALGHVAYIKQVVEILWHRKSVPSSPKADPSLQPLCLEAIVRELKLTIPLF